ncbi:MAG: hypothetical protein OEV34_04635 [Gammaproteobacteria bacterium]|nr:hypothetical protein [Gammaproteobacteria bacterium]
MRISDIDPGLVCSFLDRYGLSVEYIPDESSITGSFWGDPEAGIVGCRVFVRCDTPVHSMLHEVCHVICMTDERRDVLDRDAGGDNLEESAVCYLQIVLADYIAGVGRKRLMQDMDSWGYSFRLGSTARWFAEDAEDAAAWLQEKNLLSVGGEPVFRLRDT